MPHQCLKCGKVFEEGSSQLLKGCPDCNGNRFFFTKEPLDEKQRHAITTQTKDMHSKIIDLLGEHHGEIVDHSGKWIKLKPRDVRKAMEKHLPAKEVNSLGINDKNRKKILEQLASESDQSDKPETIDIEQSGRYKIDLKGLLEKEPIIIQKDGSYTIHLPSIFKMIDNKSR
jgi:hypothetical protein